jgi:Tol biopolymer transport system component
VVPTPVVGVVSDIRQFWMDPDLLPDRGRGIFVVDVDPSTGRVRGMPARTTQGLMDRDMSPSFSPDGKSIAFLRPRPDENGALSNNLVVRSLTTRAERTYSDGANNTPPLWWRDGTGIVFGKKTGGQVDDLQRLSLIDGSFINLAQEIRAANPASPSIYARYRHVLSPDNKTMYASARLLSATITVPDRIVARDTATWKEREIFVVPAANGIRPDFAVSPDGRTLAIVTADNRDVGGGQLVRVNVDGSGYTVLYSAAGLYYPVFTTDGRGILVGQWGAGAPLGQVLRVPVAGGKAEFTGLEIEDHFDLSPDGSRIAFDGGSYRISQTGSK